MSLIVEQWRQARRSLTRIRACMHLLALYLEAIFIHPGLQNKARPVKAGESDFNLRFWFPHVDFTRLRLFDPIRIVLQALWLIFFQQEKQTEQSLREARAAKAAAKKQRRQQLVKTSKRWIAGQFNRFATSKATRAINQFGDITGYAWLDTASIRISLTIIAALVVAFTITLPMDANSQAVMLLIFWATALWVRDVQKRGALILMVVLSVLVSSRYLYWRVTQTINWDVPTDTALSLLLLSAELYAWTILVLGYVQTIWPLKRKVAQLPEDTHQWPSVDIFIPSYNEPLSVVRPTVLAALAMDWPADKLNIYLLDDGRRSDFAEFAKSVNVGYMVRPDNSHAKAGNLNHALKKTKGDFITIFDCDHIPTRSFLQLSMGWFYADKDLALLQTPHHFFSPDPFEKNLTIFRNKPNEGELFYGLIQDGNDMWNASFFCGSCAVLKRGPLEEVGGIAVETVTEDAHTALKLHRLGYSSAYLNIPQAAGLATESLSAHIGQRIRWARGMAQIFRLDNPLIGRGLNLGQRICYANAMLYFLNGLPRIIFILAPLAFLLLHSYIVFAPAIMIALYALPHIVHSYLTNSKSQGRYRHSFWAEMYETVLAWYIMRPTLVALFAPEHGKFNVTAKGGQTPTSYFDWEVSKPYIILVMLCLIGFAFGIWRLLTGPSDEYLTVALNLLWVSYNLIILGGAVAVAEETKQVRTSNRVNVERPISVVNATGHSFAAELVDYSDRGAGIRLPLECAVTEGEQLNLIMAEGPSLNAFSVTVVSRRGDLVGTLFTSNSHEAQMALMRATFSRADAWVGWRDDTVVDRPISSFREVIAIGARGYYRMANNLMPKLQPIFDVIYRMGRGVRSLLPYFPGEKVDNEFLRF